MVVHQRGVIQALLCVLLLIMVSGPLYAASLQAVIDRSSVEFGQSVNLTVTATGLNGEIDFSVLESEFDILDTRRSRNVSIVNGKSDSSLVWQIGLMPLQAGELKIPAFAIDGVQSTALTLSVGEARSTQQAGPAGEDFFLELSSDKTDAFVQEQIILTARVYQARNIIEGSLSDPTGDGLMLQRLGSDKSFATTVDGRQYTVIERRYAIFAQESGEHTISPLRLVATVRQDGHSGSNSGFFTPTQKVRVASNKLVLSVKPKLTDSKSAWWLPAETLSLTTNWEDDLSKARVDEPITRTISLAAKAVLGTQLPPLAVPEIDGAKVYPDQPDLQTQTDGESLITYRTDKWAIIPRTAGPLRLPEIRVEWYDTINNTLQYAVVPEQVIDILPAEDTGNDVATNSTSETEFQLADNHQMTAASGLQGGNANAVAQSDELAKNWKFAFYLALLLWVLTLGGWYWQAKIKNKDVKVKLPNVARRQTPSYRQVAEACQSRDPNRIVQSILSFAKDKWRDDAPLSLGELAARLDHKPLTVHLTALDRAVYGSSTESGDFSSLVEALQTAVRTSTAPDNKSPSVRSLLPEL